MKQRLFFSVETPEPVKSEIGRMSRALQRSRADVSWEPEEKFHCTVRFLGDTDPDQIGPLVESAARIAAALPQPLVEYSGLGAFPDLRRPRVIWVGIREPEGSLLRLRREIDAVIGRLGLPPDEKAFHPHVTLGRVRGDRGLRDLITAVETATFGSAPVALRELLLVRSLLRPSGSVYTTLHAFPFATTTF